MRLCYTMQKAHSKYHQRSYHLSDIRNKYNNLDIGTCTKVKAKLKLASSVSKKYSDIGEYIIISFARTGCIF